MKTQSNVRFRNVYLVLGVLAVLAAMLWVDPDSNKVATKMLLLGLSSGVFAVAASHLSRKGLFDYIDMEKIANLANQSPQGAGLVFVGVCIVLSALLSLFGSVLRN